MDFKNIINSILDSNNKELEGEVTTERALRISDDKQKLEEVLGGIDTLTKENQDLKEENKILRSRLVDNIKYIGTKEAPKEERKLSLDESIAEAFKIKDK